MSINLQEIGIRGYRVTQVQEYHLHSILHLVAEQQTRPQCPCCPPDPSPRNNHKVYSKGPYRRVVRHLDAFGRNTYLHIHTRRYQCRKCAKSFIPPLPGIRKYRRSSEPFRRAIYQLHRDGIPGSVLARRERIGAATVERVYQEFTFLKAKERFNNLCPPVLGIDEHSIHRKKTSRRRGTRFVTTLCNLANHRVFDVVQGRSPKELDAYFRALRGKERVRVVCIDLSNSYRALITKHFPNARIVADRFHVIRTVQHHFVELVRQINPDTKYQRGQLAALRSKPETLFPIQKQTLQKLFDKHPAIQPIYQQMQKTNQLMRIKNITARRAKKLIPEYLELVQTLKDSGFQQLKTLARTLESWSEPIACMWRFSKNNGITEGFHRKMKLIQRRAYGFKNFENYRLRVLAECA